MKRIPPPTPAPALTELDHACAFASSGGKARARILTQAKRKAIAKKAALSRWAKHKHTKGTGKGKRK